MIILHNQNMQGWVLGLLQEASKKFWHIAILFTLFIVISNKFATFAFTYKPSPGKE